jgi:hypothetical protein
MLVATQKFLANFPESIAAEWYPLLEHRYYTELL